MKYHKPFSKSIELPHKKAYLDSRNNSTEQSFEKEIFEKKLNGDIPISIKRITSYGNLYSRNNFSLSKHKGK